MRRNLNLLLAAGALMMASATPVFAYQAKCDDIEHQLQSYDGKRCFQDVDRQGLTQGEKTPDCKQMGKSANDGNEKAAADVMLLLQHCDQ